MHMFPYNYIHSIQSFLSQSVSQSFMHFIRSLISFRSSDSIHSSIHPSMLSTIHSFIPLSFLHIQLFVPVPTHAVGLYTNSHH